MFKNRQGLVLTTSVEAAATGFDATIGDYLTYRLSAGDRLKQVVAADPGFALGHCLHGYFLMLFGTRAMDQAAGKALVLAETHMGGASERERSHVAALRAWLNGDIVRACRIWEDILAVYPRDLLALRMQHFNLFWMGESERMRDVAGRALAGWDETTPDYGFVLGVRAFGLEETGAYDEAEALGRRAVSLNNDDLWAVHAVAHVLEMQGRLAEGSRWLNQPVEHWADRNPFTNHLWWHAALFAFESGDYAAVLDLYDRTVRPDDHGLYLDVQNAVSLLARLDFMGVDVGDRWTPVADIAEGRVDDHVLVFTDLHFLIALMAGGRLPAAERLVDSMRAFGAETGSAAFATANAGVPTAEGLLAFGRHDFGKAVAILSEAQPDWQSLGASHAQRDILTQFLIEAALRDGQFSRARALLGDRVSRRPNSRGNWLKFAEALDGPGEIPEAARARARSEAAAISA